MRGIANDPEAAGNAKSLGTKVVTSEEIHRSGVAAAINAIPQSENIYVTFDVDSMDPTLAPGTGTLEPGGLNFAEIDELMKGIPAKGRLVGLDIVEVNPYRGPQRAHRANRHPSDGRPAGRRFPLVRHRLQFVGANLSDPQAFKNCAEQGRYGTSSAESQNKSGFAGLEKASWFCAKASESANRHILGEGACNQNVTNPFC